MDFTVLSDDQLLQLIQASMAEAVNRGVAMAKAAQDTYDDAAYKLQVEREIQANAEAERIDAIKQGVKAKAKANEQKKFQEKQAQIWAHSSAVVTALKEDRLFKDDTFSINIWEKKNDVRVYLQEEDRNGWEIIFYVTGNSWHPPGSIQGADGPKTQARLKAFFNLLCENWQPGFKAKSSGTSFAPNPEKLAQYKKALEVKEEVNV